MRNRAITNRAIKNNSITISIKMRMKKQMKKLISIIIKTNIVITIREQQISLLKSCQMSIHKIQEIEQNAQLVVGNSQSKLCKSIRKYAKRYLCRRERYSISRSRGRSKMKHRMIMGLTSLHLKREINSNKKQKLSRKRTNPLSNQRLLSGKLKVKCLDRP